MSRDVTVFLKGDSKGFDSAVDKSESKLKNFAKSASAKAQQIGKVFSVAGAAITASFGAMISKTVSFGDTLDKMAGRTGVNEQALSEWKHALELSGSSLTDFESSLKGMGKFLLNAKDGSKRSVDAMKELGLSYANLSRLSPEKQFEAISNSISAVENPTLRAAYAQRIFGGSGTQLLPMLAQGKEGMAAMREEAVKLGITMSEEQANKMAALADQWDRLIKSIGGFGQQVALILEPVLMPLLTWLTETIIKIREWTTEHPKLTKFIVVFTAALGAAMAVLGPLLLALSALPAILTWLGTAIALVTSPFTLWAAAIATVATVGYKVGTWINDFIDKNLKPLANMIDRIFDKIVGLIEKFKVFLGISNAPRSDAEIFGSRTQELIASGAVPRYASGTRNSLGGLALVGEQGPELVNLSRGSQVYSAGETSKMLGNNFSINVNAAGNADGNLIGRQIAEELNKWSRLQRV